MASDPAQVLPAAETTHGVVDPFMHPVTVENLDTRVNALETYGLSEMIKFHERLTALETKLENVGGTWLAEMKAWFQRHT